MDAELKGVRDVGEWVAKNSLSLVEEMNSLNQFAFSSRIPLLVAFLDPLDKNTSQEFIWGYKRLAERHEGTINFVWVDFRDNLKMMKRLGVRDCR